MYCISRNLYSETIKWAKLEFWEAYLSELDETNIWSANRIVSTPHSNGSRQCIPTLISQNARGTTEYARTDEEKCEAFQTNFFPPHTNVRPPKNLKYPPPKYQFEPITNKQVIDTFEHLNPKKASGIRIGTGSYLRVVVPPENLKSLPEPNR